MIPFGEWLPDQPENMERATEALNVYSAANGYLPHCSFSVISSALDSRARGAQSFKDSSEDVYTYAGTTASLYDVSDSPTDVTRSGDPYATANEDIWEMTKWGDQCIATNYFDEPQEITLGGSNFADLGGSPPRAKYIATVGNFVVLGYINDSVDGVVPNRVHWSAFEDATGWTPGTSQSDIQDLLGNGGAVRKVIGGDYGIVFQDRAIQRMDYVGTPLVFQFNEVEPEKGAWMSGGVVQFGRSVYYISRDGFYELVDGSTSYPIGHEKVNRYFLADFDASYPHRVTAAIDMQNSSIVWSYPGVGNSGGTPNKQIIYNWVTKKFTRAELEIDLLFRGLSIGYTLDQLDPFGTLDTLPASLDSMSWKGGAETLYGFDTSFRYGSFSGPALDAVVETEEHGGNDRTYISAVRPHVEGGTPTVQIATRDNLTDNVTLSAEASLAATGRANVRSNSRYARVRVNISGGFDHAVGVEVTGRKAGRQ